MNRTTFGKDRPFTIGQCWALGCLALVGMTTGCPNGGPGSSPGNGGGDGGTEPAGATTVEVITFRIDFKLSELDGPVDVLYSVLTDKDASAVKVSAFYVPVGSDGSDAELGDRIIIATGLPIGVNQPFRFDPSVAGVGTYRVGVVAEIGTEQTVDKSKGVIRVEGRPMPEFIQPVNVITEVSLGAVVVVSFDAGDPEDEVQWRVFYLADTDLRTVSADEIGTELAVGQGNVGTTIFSTAGLPAGDYEIGISATDSGVSIGATVANGALDRIVTIPTVADPDGVAQGGPIVRVLAVRTELPPTLDFSNPSDIPIPVFGDAIVNIEFEVAINEPGAIGNVEIFYDDDQIFNNGVESIQANLPGTATTVAFDTRVIPQEGVYFIGGSVLDSANPRLVEYASGTIDLIRSGTLDVLEPSVSSSLKPVEPGGTPVSIPISWETNVPTNAGSVEVFARSVAGDTDVALLDPSPAPTSVTSAEFRADMVADKSGLYDIVVKITFNDASKAPLEVKADGSIRVTGLPTVLWLGDLVANEPTFDGVILEGIRTEDNAGSAFTRVGDLNSDGFDEFVVAARYGKPFTIASSGIGPGEAYLIFGDQDRLTGSVNLNAVGNSLMGATFTGIRTPQEDTQTDGLASISRIPDLDGDGRDELVFGFPSTNSRGHNVDQRQNGSVDPRSLATLEREEQFLRGGIVIVSSTNSALSVPATSASTIRLDLVGQNFLSKCVSWEAGDTIDRGDFAVDTRTDFVVDPVNDTSIQSAGDSCEGGCGDVPGFGTADANNSLNYGFVRALARDFFNTYIYSSELYGGPATFCPAAGAFLNNDCLTLHPEAFSSAATTFDPLGNLVCDTDTTCRFPALDFCLPAGIPCQPNSPGLHSVGQGVVYETVTDATTPAGDALPTIQVPEYGRRSGFYETTVDDGVGFPFLSNPIEPLGARVIGVGLGDQFGSSITLVRPSGTGSGDLIISAPGRAARDRSLGPFGGPEAGGEILGLGAADIRTDSGVAYLFSLRDLWSPDNSFNPPAFPPRPHQYIVGEPSHCAGGVARLDNITATRIAGDTDDAITNVVGIDDFNNDGRDDFAIGVPDAEFGLGRLYIAFRPDPSVETDFVLEKLALDPNDSENDRLDGVLIRSTELDRFGFSLTSGVDFNGDDVADLVIGSPDANGGIGEIIIVFGDANLITPTGGMTLEDLLSVGNIPPRAVRITGNALDIGGAFGFNVASTGDVDNDGLVDLLVAAPGASPRFDPTPNDAVDELTDIGVDTDLDGVVDENSEDIGQAGLVYVIFGQDLIDPLPLDASDPPSAQYTISIDRIGSVDLKGYMIAGRHGGDRLGGGDAGDLLSGGNSGKTGRGRSFGLAGAGDIDGDGRDDILIGSVLANPRRSQGSGVINGGEAYLIYSTVNP